jgi:phosphomannomutase
MTDTLMVGVSGVRGIVGKDLTEEVVERYAAAFGQWAVTRRPLVVVGRDARESGPSFERAVTQGLAAAGCAVVTVGIAPTPTIQLAVEHHRAGGGIAITASHNPIEWNALKFIGPDGIFLDGADGKRVLELVGQDGGGRGRSGEGKVVRDPGAIDRHLDAVLKLPAVDTPAIRARKFTVALDAVRGAGGPVMRTLLERLGCRVTGINLETDGRFPRPPEPVPENLGELSALVRRSGSDLGIAIDPDVDRLAIVDETGGPIGEDYTLAFAVRAVLGGRLESGKVGMNRPVPSNLPTAQPSVVVCNLSTSLVVEDAARDCGAEIVRTPVGEVHVARAILRLGAVIGGEGNGGVMYPVLHAGRDAPLAAALLLTLLAREGQRVSQVVAAAPRYAIVKTKVERRAGDLERTYAALRRRFADAQVDTQDGLRLAWPDRWLHVRPSNTEPIIRLIAEATSDAAARELVDEGRRLCAASITA